MLNNNTEISRILAAQVKFLTEAVESLAMAVSQKGPNNLRDVIENVLGASMAHGGPKASI